MLALDKTHFAKAGGKYNKKGRFLEVVGTTKEGEPRNTYRRDLEVEINKIKKSWR
uniref:Uncharacterized protein n=1 Tax=Arion vulgaris TaxID=1028688 RepID=A0A0B7BL42_9EUPU